MSLLRTTGLQVAVGGRRLVEDLDWEVSPGQLWCVLGRNGVGKSSLLYVLAGLVPSAAGQVLIAGRSIDAWPAGELARRRGLMAQQQLDAFSHSVRDTVSMGRTPYRVGGGWDTDQDRAAVEAALRQVGLAERADADILHLSGGERQRVALATLLTQAPEIMLLDEPTSHQDVAHQLEMMRLIRELARDKAVVATCHDINLAARFATHVMVLAPGRHWIGPAQEVLGIAVLEQAFGCRFETVEAAGGRSFVGY